MGRFPVFPRQVCRYNPFGMLRFQTSTLTRLSAVSELFGDLLRLVNASVRSQSSLVAENLFLRKQLAFYQERKARPRRLTDAARLTLVLWSRWFNWRDALIIVKPETLIGWHRKGFKEYSCPDSVRYFSAQPFSSRPDCSTYLAGHFTAKQEGRQDLQTLQTTPRVNKLDSGANSLAYRLR
jgi:hypothetical protein